MSFVVFLRAVNVGGRNTFRPSLFARELAHLGAINVGAAGTFVIPGAPSKAKLSADLAQRLPVSADLMICSGRELVELAEAPFSSLPLEEGMRRFVSVMAARPRKPPALPLSRPSGKDWEVKVVGVSGRFALSLCRRLGRSFVDPNAVVEKSFGVRSTTRNWNTVAKICEILR
jgi:uncharacterized protein (DUF1697 family)